MTQQEVVITRNLLVHVGCIFRFLPRLLLVASSLEGGPSSRSRLTSTFSLNKKSIASAVTLLDRDDVRSWMMRVQRETIV
jgi:hypothetical protein